MAGVQVLKVSRVTLQPGTYPPPGETVELSFFDSMWVSLPHVQRLFLYPNTDDASFPMILDSLKSSLARILPSFHPFAGKVTYIPSAARAIIDCSASAIGEGVAIIEAESDLDIHRIAKEEVHDIESFAQLVPNIAVPELPAEVLAVQITRFLKGGVALGVAVHHTVADGKGLWQFFEAWFSTCRTGNMPLEFTPVHNRAVIKYPGGDEIAKEFTKKGAPALPKTLAPRYSLKERLRRIRRTFLIDMPTIRSWKKLAGDETPSTFVTIAARVLVTVVSVRGLANDDGPFSAALLPDCRSRLDPPIGDNYIGNCVSSCFAWMIASDIGEPDGFIRACIALKGAIRKATEEPLVGVEGWGDEFLKVPPKRIINFVGSPRFKAYETDFGWGKPDRVELASMNHDGEVVMVSGKDEGTVQVSVGLDAEHMNAFAAKFLT